VYSVRAPALSFSAQEVLSIPKTVHAIKAAASDSSVLEMRTLCTHTAVDMEAFPKPQFSPLPVFTNS